MVYQRENIFSGKKNQVTYICGFACLSNKSEKFCQGCKEFRNGSFDSCTFLVCIISEKNFLCKGKDNGKKNARALCKILRCCLITSINQFNERMIKSVRTKQEVSFCLR